jgi:hypothetical protein
MMELAELYQNKLEETLITIETVRFDLLFIAAPNFV